MLDIDSSERERLTAIYNEHGDFLFKAAMIHLGNVADAQTAVIDTVIAIRGCKIPTDKEKYTRAYLLTVLEHQVQRQQIEKRTHAFSSFEDWMNTTAEDPESQLLQKEKYRIIKSYMQMMSQADKTVLMLAEFNTPRQIAEILGLKLATVHKRLQRARAKLRDICNREGWFDD